MDKCELRRLIRLHPKLYHLTAPGCWESVMEHGLLSTNALIERSGMSPERKFEIGRKRRSKNEEVCIPQPACVPESSPSHETGHGRFLKAVIRDQKPLILRKLRDQLDYQGACITEEEWFVRQNERVFFFLSRDSVSSMMKVYKEQDMLVVCTKTLVKAYCDRIELSAYNSGFNRWDRNDLSSYVKPYKLHDELFLPIRDYPYSYWHGERGDDGPVRELTILEGVCNIADYVIKAKQMSEGKTVKVLYERNNR